MVLSKSGRLVEGSQIREHPKRVPAEQSVCLRRSPSSQVSLTGNPTLNRVPKQSPISGETSAKDAVPDSPSKKVPAKVWFDNSNENVSNGDVRFVFDDDPPFYLKQSRTPSNEERTSPGLNSLTSHHIVSRQSRAESTLPNLRTIDSSSEDYRSVIDDLTVENQKLRAKLKKYEKLHNSQSQSDKLFEIKVYALPPAKKRKLEKTLQDFTSDLGDCSEPPSLRAQNRSVDANSNSNSRDSGYVSATGAASASQAHLAGLPRRPDLKQRNHSRPYIHSTSPSLIRRSSMGLSEKEKMELVVRRLERVFIGKTTGAPKSNLLQYKRDLSPSGSDQMEIDPGNHNLRSEGHREAKILPTNGDRIPAQLRASPGNSSSGGTSDGSIDQRPTYPTDLDPSRTQTPTDNIKYMRHLGFSSPKMGPNTTYEEGEGWIYLNLLVGMAQLHTINVTPDFVRKAVTKLSTNFELSDDGHSIRWKGGNSPTQMPSDGSATWRSTGSSSNEYEGSANIEIRKQNRPPVKGVYDPDGSSQDTKGDPVGAKALGSQASTSSFQAHYKPVIFNRSRSSDDSFDISVGGSSSPMLYGSDDATTRHSGQIRKERYDNYRQEYFSNVKFYTDFSKEEERSLCESFDNDRYVIGRTAQQNERDLDENKGPLSRDPVDELIGPIESLSSSSSLEGLEQFPTSNSRKADAESNDAFPLEASGVGGVHPEDNFSINVAVQHSSGAPTARSRIISENIREYPAQLPPPSYTFHPFSSSSSDDEEYSDNEESEETDFDEETQNKVATREAQQHNQPNMFLFAEELAANSDNSDAPNLEKSGGNLGKRPREWKRD